MSDLSNTVILISGASSGIGEATTRELAAAGAKVMIGARRTGRRRHAQRQLAERDGIEMEHEAEVGVFRRRFDDAPRRGQVVRHDAVAAGGVNEHLIAELDLLHALHGEAQERLVDVRHRHRGGGGSNKGEPFDRCRLDALARRMPGDQRCDFGQDFHAPGFSCARGAGKAKWPCLEDRARIPAHRSTASAHRITTMALIGKGDRP